jgi:CRP/FNR family transcriptional regulator, cyclic AMP receptor protein
MKNRLPMELSTCALFSALDAPDKERLASLLRPQAFNKDEIIFLKGDSGSGLYLIRSGKVKICVIDRNGFELIFTFLSGGDLLGEIAVLDGKARSATAIAVDNTDMLYLGRKEFLEFLKTSPQACIDIITMLSQRLRRVSNQLEEVSFLDVSGRIARSILEMTGSSFHNVANVEHQLICAISQEELAKVIGASRVMVNKVLNSYVDLGFISIARKKITVLNIHELNRIACYDGNS